MQLGTWTPQPFATATSALAWTAFGASLSLQWAALLSGSDAESALAEALLCLGLIASLFAMAAATMQAMQREVELIDIDLNAVMGNVGIWLLFAAAAWAMILTPPQAPRDALPCLLCTLAAGFALARWAQTLRTAHHSHGATLAAAL